MKITIVIPNEPFYIVDNLNYFLSQLENKHDVVSCVLLSPSPYGKRKNFLQKALETFKIFGFSFFMYYTLKYIYNLFFKISVHELLRKKKIKIIQLKKTINHSSSILKITDTNPDIIISILSNEIFKTPILNAAQYGCINLHCSLLPKYRGVMPSFWALKNNENHTGVTVFSMDEGIDTGKIILQRNVEIQHNDTQSSIIKKTKRIGMELLSKSVDLIESGKVRYIENNDLESSYFSFPTRKDVIEFKKTRKFF